MRTAGPNEASLRIVDAPKGAGRGESLESGTVVFIRVHERIGPDPKAGKPGSALYRVSLRSESDRAVFGKDLFVASSAHSLEPGSLMKASVERSGDAILLRMSGREPSSPSQGQARTQASTLVSAAGLPPDTAAFSALAALLREGMAPEPRALARVRRVALQDDGERIKLAARMEAKGIPAEEEALDDLLRGSAAAPSFGGRGASDSREGEADAGSARQEGGAEFGNLERDIERSVPEAELPRVLAAFLRALATRAGGLDDDGPGREGASLALFNHMRGPEGSWVIVPFGFALDAVDFAGNFRIQLPYVRGGAGLVEAHFSASQGAEPEDWTVLLAFGGGRDSMLRIEAPESRKSSMAGVSFDAFEAELAAMRCSLSIGPRREAEGDGSEGLDVDA
jgi:hypothetical protein